MTQTAATYSDIMLIDHDPRELSRTAIKAVAWVTLAVTAVIMVFFASWVRWAIGLLPDAAIFALAGLAFGLGIGFKLGWWDRGRHLRTTGKDE